MSSPGSESTAVQEELEQLESILSREEYTVYLRQAKGDGFDLFEWIGRQLSKLFPTFELPPGTGKAFEYAVYIALLAIIVIAIVWLSRQLVRRGRIRAWAELQEEAAGRSPQQYLELAQQLAADGKLREAVRSGFLALLLELERQTRLKIEGWKTNWDYAEELRRSDAEAEVRFREAAALFDRSWYGYGAVTAGEYEELYKLVTELMRSGEEARHAQME
ncbi:DUF4129 domain-containing protein [Paenibacillus chartarius]|uniref:DUF4129 domain-containing protein n=1 Tax=Paenibacillus chartarius TaxID=747481 RepID=A0ABV6DF51_9BACL